MNLPNAEAASIDVSLGDRNTILPDPCNSFCFVEGLMVEAIKEHADSKAVIEATLDHLSGNPCERLKTGNCEAVVFLAQRALYNKASILSK